MMNHYKLVLKICLFFCPLFAAGQIPVTDTLFVQADTLRYTYNPNNSSDVFRFSKMDSLTRFNTPRKFEKKNSSFTFATGAKKIVVADQDGKLPFRRIAVTDGSTLKYLQVNFFGALESHYSKEYQKQFGGKVTYEIPEVYELANIALSLTDAGRSDGNMIEQSGTYAADVRTHFEPFRQHPLIERLNKRLGKGDYNFYYGVRENAYAMAFDAEGKLVNRGVYDNVWPGVNDIAEYAVQWADFAIKSSFRSFYRGKLDFYKKQREDVAKLLSVKQMQQWLEKRFAQTHYDCQRIVFSPLINGAHSAQKFEDQGFHESLMFVCDAKRYDRNKLSATQIAGLYSGIVFTEIDHNYVNPVSDKYLDRINSVFGDRAKWTKGGDAAHYGNAYEVFNEYMTHSVHLLYVKDQFPKDVYQAVYRDRVALNADQRGFYRFEAFTNQLEKLYKKNRSKATIDDLYTPLLEWAASVN